MNQICIVIPYFGKLPLLFKAFVDSCRLNPKIDFLLFTDDSLSEAICYPSNFKLIRCDFDFVHSLAPKDIRDGLKSPYKLCDYKPTYGALFAQYLKDYKFWGYCDIDLLLGKLDDFIDHIDLEKYDRLFDFGHLTIYRNNNEINNLFRRTIDGLSPIDSIDYIYGTQLSCNADECLMNKKSAFFLKDRWLRSALFSYADIIWRYPYFAIKGDSHSCPPQFFVHTPEGRILHYCKSDNGDIEVTEYFYIHMLRRSFYPVSSGFDFSQPYLITHKGLLPFDETKIETYFSMFSNPTTTEIADRDRWFTKSLRKTKLNKIQREFQCYGLCKAVQNLFKQLWYAHLVPLFERRNLF